MAGSVQGGGGLGKGRCRAPTWSPTRAAPPLPRLVLQVGYVQSRWVFTNPQESYLTKAQAGAGWAGG